MTKRRYLLAILCYLAIPVVVIGLGGLAASIDPEWARGHDNYARNFQLLQLARWALMMATFGLALVLWLACCALLLTARQRSLGWLALAIAGPFGFAAMATLEDRAPLADDLYQRVIGKMKPGWRVALEIALLVAIWNLAYELMVLKRDLMIGMESLRTGTSAAAILARQNESSGMWAFAEGMEVIYLVMLICLLWPIIFNFAGRLFKTRAWRKG